MLDWLLSWKMGLKAFHVKEILEKEKV